MISPSVSTRFSRDDTPHRLGAIAANLARIETFASRPYPTEAVLTVLNETQNFVEWAARNLDIDNAVSLVELQKLVVTWRRDGVWTNRQPEHSRRAEIARQAGLWSQRLLDMSRLAEAPRSNTARAPIAIPPGHKFAIIALDVWHGVDSVETNAGYFTRMAPVHPAEFWKEWMGSLWYDQFRRTEQSGLHLVAIRPSSSPDVRNSEEREVCREAENLRLGLALASQYFKCPRAMFIVGTHGEHGCQVNSTSWLPPFPRRPGSRAIQLTEADMYRAAQFALALREISSDTRLFRSLLCFLRGMETQQASERLHAFVRCVDGLIMPRKGRSTDDFVAAVGSVVEAGENVLRQIYQLRSADEHMHDPLDEVRDEADPRGLLFERTDQAEAIARHMLSQILAVASLRRLYDDDADAGKYWRGEERGDWMKLRLV